MMLYDSPPSLGGATTKQLRISTLRSQETWLENKVDELREDASNYERELEGIREELVELTRDYDPAH